MSQKIPSKLVLHQCLLSFKGYDENSEGGRFYPRPSAGLVNPGYLVLAPSGHQLS